MIKILRFLVIILMSQSLVFVSFAHAGQLALPSGDLIAPQITHEPLTESIKAGSNQQIKATVTDNVEVKTVTLFYRTIGSVDYKRINMDKVADTTDYIATLGFEDTVEPGVEYYIQAVDLAGNALLFGYSFSPLKVAIVSSEPTFIEPAPINNPLTKKKTNTWLWIGLGVLGVGLIAAAVGGSDGGNAAGAPNPETGSVTITAPVPQN